MTGSAAAAREDAHDGRIEVGTRHEARPRRESQREGRAADEEVRARQRRADTATGVFAGCCGGGFESVSTAAIRSTAIATALSPTSVRASVPVTPGRSMRGTARK